MVVLPSLSPKMLSKSIIDIVSSLLVQIISLDKSTSLSKASLRGLLLPCSIVITPLYLFITSTVPLFIFWIVLVKLS